MCVSICISVYVCVPVLFAQEERVLLLTPDTCLQTPVSEDDLVWIKENGGRSGVHTLTVEYEHYSGHAVLRAVLSEYANEIPTGFEIVGHIAHLNLRKDFLPYKTLIGQFRYIRTYIVY